MNECGIAAESFVGGEAQRALPAGLCLGHYEIVEVLGLGEGCITYRALDVEYQKAVVIKEFCSSACSYRLPDEMELVPVSGGEAEGVFRAGLQKFVSRGNTLSGISLPGFPSPWGVFTALGSAYYVRLYEEGSSLGCLDMPPDRITEDWLRRFLTAVLTSLSALHGQGLLHSRISMDHIVLRRDGSPVLIGTELFNGEEPEFLARDRNAFSCMAPEYFVASREPAPCSDLYSLGAVCCRLMTGEYPPVAGQRIISSDSWKPLSSRPALRERFGAALLGMLDKALSPEMKARWQSADEWLKELDVLAQPVCIHAGKSRRGVKIISAAAVLAALAGAGVYLLNLSPEQAVEAPAGAGSGPQMADASQPRRGSSGIAQAARVSDAETLGRLIEAGADVNAVDSSGFTALNWAVYNGSAECVKLLLAAPEIDVNRADSQGFTPLFWAIYKNNSECVRLLLAAPGTDVNRQDKNGCTPLFWAARNGFSDGMQCLLNTPAIGVNKAGLENKTPLYEAALNGHAECVQLLLAAPGVEVNAADIHGLTPLSVAADSGHVECVRLLLAAPGVAPGMRDKFGRSALDLAEAAEYTEILELLRSAQP